jgi:hypothetical protein
MLWNSRAAACLCYSDAACFVMCSAKAMELQEVSELFVWKLVANGRLSHRQEDNIKMNNRGVGWGDGLDRSGSG